MVGGGPEDRSVTAYCSLRQAAILHEGEALDGENVVSGFSCRVADLPSPYILTTLNCLSKK